VGWEPDGVDKLRGDESVGGGVWAECRCPGGFGDLTVPLGCPAETSAGVYTQGLAEGSFEPIKDGRGLEAQAEEGVPWVDGFADAEHLPLAVEAVDHRFK
jgi:hypothetical protein